MSDEVSTQEVMEEVAQGENLDTTETTASDVDPLDDLNSPIEDETSSEVDETKDESEIDWKERAILAEEAKKRTEGNAKKLQRLESKIKPSILEMLADVPQEKQDEAFQRLFVEQKQEQKPQEDGKPQPYTDWQDKDKVIDKLSESPAETLWAASDMMIQYRSRGIIDQAVKEALEKVQDNFKGVRTEYDNNQVDREYKEVEKFAGDAGVTLEMGNEKNKAYQGMMSILEKDPNAYDNSNNPLKDLFRDFYMEYTSKSKTKSRNQARMEAASSPQTQPVGDDIESLKGKNMGELEKDALEQALSKYRKGGSGNLDDS